MRILVAVNISYGEPGLERRIVTAMEFRRLAVPAGVGSKPESP